MTHSIHSIHSSNTVLMSHINLISLLLKKTSGGHVFYNSFVYTRTSLTKIDSFMSIIVRLKIYSDDTTNNFC